MSDFWDIHFADFAVLVFLVSSFVALTVLPRCLPALLAVARVWHSVPLRTTPQRAVALERHVSQRCMNDTLSIKAGGNEALKIPKASNEIHDLSGRGNMK